ncbi:hypothetical protein E2C01_041707 [Portunus trituberculatus]|uniref:Uncharacterized protein n=1 Tax=Portunus trituberculatus TaxID=210409 RepID=A0A5B7FR32_PORTR|nr:hypothetical protein [Portunus trituberculatus]
MPLISQHVHRAGIVFALLVIEEGKEEKVSEEPRVLVSTTFGALQNISQAIPTPHCGAPTIAVTSQKASVPVSWNSLKLQSLRRSTLATTTSLYNQRAKG